MERRRLSFPDGLKEIDLHAEDGEIDMQLKMRQLELEAGLANVKNLQLERENARLKEALARHA